MRTRKIGVTASALVGEIKQIPKRARLAGFGGIEFDAVSPSFDLTGLSISGKRELCHLLASENQELSGLRVDIGINGFALGSDVDQAIARIDRGMQAARDLACGVVCVDLGPLPEVPPEDRPQRKIDPLEAGLILIPDFVKKISPDITSSPVKVNPAFVDQVDSAMRELAIRTDRIGVMVVFRSDLAGFVSLERVVRSVNCPWFGVDLDPAAILRDELGIDQIFDRLGTLVRHVRARDAVIGTNRRTKPCVIGQGAMNWEQLLGLLDDAGCNSWITIDPSDLSDRLTGATVGLQHIIKFGN